jgi:hypothetical protein
MKKNNAFVYLGHGCDYDLNSPNQQGCIGHETMKRFLPKNSA